jgi:hypothetical protein
LIRAGRKRLPSPAKLENVRRRFAFCGLGLHLNGNTTSRPHKRKARQ